MHRPLGQSTLRPLALSGLRCLPAATAPQSSTHSWNKVYRNYRLMSSLAALPGAVAPACAVSSAYNRQLLSVAPMMDWTDVHYRQLARIISKRTWLWTEMVVDKTILHTPFLDNFLWFPPEQHPIVCQLGGSDPETLAAATRKAAEYGYDEINLNCGCPSDRVAGAGCFGASLMLQPDLVAACMKAMAEASNGIPVTVKCRLGVDEVDSYAQLQQFVQVVSTQSPVKHFIVHARKCFLKGLNPHQNRTVPPLRHEWVYSLRRDFPHLMFSLNGGVQSCHEARAVLGYEGPWPTPEQPAAEQLQQQDERAETHAAGDSTGTADGACGTCCLTATPLEQQEQQQLQQEQQQQQQERIELTQTRNLAAQTSGSRSGAGAGVDAGVDAGAGDAGSTCSLQPLPDGLIEGVMIGRAAYNDPWGCLGDADRALFGESSNAARSRREVLERYIQYADAATTKQGTREGYRAPNVRTLVKPLLGLFHAEPGSKRWKAALDTVLKQDPPSLSYVLEATLHHIPNEVLDAPPRITNTFPRCSFGELAQPDDRAGGAQTLSALKRASREAAAQPHSKRVDRLTEVSAGSNTLPVTVPA